MEFVSVVFKANRLPLAACRFLIEYIIANVCSSRPSPPRPIRSVFERIGVSPELKNSMRSYARANQGTHTQCRPLLCCTPMVARERRLPTMPQGFETIVKTRDAARRRSEWIAILTKKDLLTPNPTVEGSVVAELM